MKYAVQLYTVREEAKEDFFKVLDDVKAMGYEGVELAGFNGVEPQVLANKLQELGLTVVASHVDFSSQPVENIIRDHKILGCTKLVIPWHKLKSAEDLDALVIQIKDLSKALVPHGLDLLYHNHDHEFIQLDDGEVALDALFARTKSLLQSEVDTHWVARAGLNPIEYLEQLGERVKLIHIKDMQIDDEGNKDFAAVGEGIMDIKGILGKAEELSISWAIVENDAPKPNGLDNIKRSMDYLKRLEGDAE